MTYTLAATVRTVRGDKVRTTKQVPAVIYGAGTGAQSLTINLVDFIKLYRQAGASSLIDLTIDGKESGKVLVQEVQSEPVKDRIIHVDLRRIDMNKAMTAPITLKFTGESPIIKSSGGTLVTSVQAVEVKCLPKDLVSHIDVDLSNLINYDVVIKIKDLKLPAGITVVNPHAEDLVVKAARALTEEEIKAMEEASSATVDLSKIEVEKKGKEEEAAEGPASAEATAGKEAATETKAKKEEKK